MPVLTDKHCRVVPAPEDGTRILVMRYWPRGVKKDRFDVLVAAIGIDGQGAKHVLTIAEGATENAATVQAMLDNLTARGLDHEIRLFVVDGAKALSKAIRWTFGIAFLVGEPLAPVLRQKRDHRP